MIICFNEKYGPRYVQGNTDGEILTYVLKKRINEHWYDCDEAFEAEQMIEKQNAAVFMHNRRNHEYEGYDVVLVEEVK